MDNTHKKKIIGIASVLAHLADYKDSNIEDYEADEQKYDKFIELIKYCKGLEQSFDCELFRCTFDPRWIDGSVEMIFHSDWAVGRDNLKQLTSILSKCDGINISTTPLGEDWIEVTFFILGLWKHKNSK